MNTEAQIRKEYYDKVIIAIILPMICKYFDKQYKGKPLIVATLKDYIK